MSFENEWILTVKIRRGVSDDDDAFLHQLQIEPLADDPTGNEVELVDNGDGTHQLNLDIYSASFRTYSWLRENLNRLNPAVVEPAKIQLWEGGDKEDVGWWLGASQEEIDKEVVRAHMYQIILWIKQLSPEKQKELQRILESDELVD